MRVIHLLCPSPPCRVPQPHTTQYLISCINTTFELSPCHPRSPLAVIKNRHVGSTTVISYSTSRSRPQQLTHRRHRASMMPRNDLERGQARIPPLGHILVRLQVIVRVPQPDIVLARRGDVSPVREPYDTADRARFDRYAQDPHHVGACRRGRAAHVPDIHRTVSPAGEHLVPVT